MFQQNIVLGFLSSVERHPHRPCFIVKEGGHWKRIQWKEALQLVMAMAQTLKKSGVKKGDRVAILSNTRVEWTIADLAILSLGAVTVPIYHSNTPEQVLYILKNSESKSIFVENDDQAAKVELVRRKAGSLKHVIVIQTKKKGSTKDKALMTWNKAIADGLKKLDRKTWLEGVEDVTIHDMATIVYTSGTTGNPKGVVLNHEQFLSEVEGLHHHLDVHSSQVALLILPLAHIFGRSMQMFQVCQGFTHAYGQRMDTLIDDLQSIRPHFFGGVPRMFEKIYEGIFQKVAKGSSLERFAFRWATDVGLQVGKLRQKNEEIPVTLMAQWHIADNLIFRKVRKILGGRNKMAFSGGAPLAREIAEFFYSAGVMLLEGYGLTETTAAVTWNGLEDFQFGTVGKPLYQVQLKIASDGEILVKGPMVFQEYFGNPKSTTEVLTKDRWFHTGDIGEIDAKGFLKITDRKKDIIVLSNGKNIAPQNIENLLKTDPYISQAVVYGDRRKYLTAMVTLNKEPIMGYARKAGLDFSAFEDLVENDEIKDLIKKSIADKNKSLASYETIKNFTILPQDFSLENGELTPTLKLKRRVVNQKYKDIIDQLYH